jgi:hypothetical protein
MDTGTLVIVLALATLGIVAVVALYQRRRVGTADKRGEFSPSGLQEQEKRNAAREGRDPKL